MRQVLKHAIAVAVSYVYFLEVVHQAVMTLVTRAAQIRVTITVTTAVMLAVKTTVRLRAAGRSQTETVWKRMLSR